MHEAFVAIDVQRISVSYEIALSTADIANFDNFLGNLYPEHFQSRNREVNAS